ncbi:MAG: sigma-54 dependent transcriptional regulator [Pseudomonadota bacterium]
MSTRVLIADDEPNLRTVLSATLRRAGYEVVATHDGSHALSVIEQSRHDDPVGVVVTDLRMPHTDGLDLLRALRKSHADLPVILITAHGTVDNAVEALKAGAFDFITKPFEQDELLAVVQKAAASRALGEQETQGSDPTSQILVGESAELRSVVELIERVADTPSTVLISGESGTGKELVATALHRCSSRRERPFIKIHCAAIPHGLIESELFGHDRGAFTGATATKPGRFELADRGSLFLDEVAEIPLEIQVKLLRALQEKAFEHIGGVKTIQIDVRLITATNRDLAQAVREGSFREDLYYRLAVVPIHLPPLRQRPSDIPLLVEHFRRHFNARLGREVERFSDEAMTVLRGYPWPGNIRELENIVERTLLFSDGPAIEAADLPPELTMRSAALVRADVAGSNLARAAQLDGASLKDVVRRATADLERELIRRALGETQGNVTQAAQRLKISRKSLQLKMRELGLREDSRLP